MTRAPACRRRALQGAAALPGLGLAPRGLTPALTLLLVLMALDLLAGSSVALMQGRTRLRILWRGLLRKSICLLVVLAGTLLEHSLAASGLPPVRIALVVTLFYAAHEALSLLEHAHAAGAPVPRFLQQFLRHLRDPNPLG